MYRFYAVGVSKKSVFSILITATAGVLCHFGQVDERTRCIRCFYIQFINYVNNVSSSLQG